MTAAAAMALAKAHGVEIALDSRGVLVMRSYGPIPPDVRLALKSAKPELTALFARDGAGALTDGDLLDALRRKGFVISLTGSDRDLRDVVAERRPLFERLLSGQAPD